MKIKILTPTGQQVKELNLNLKEYSSEYRIIIEDNKQRVLYEPKAKLNK